MRNRGFTLLEALIAVVVIAILAGIAIPQYNKAVQRSYWRTARDLLQTIYAGEQVYETANATYIDPTGCAPPWRCIYMDNPATGTIPVTYAVSAAKTTFTAAATYQAKTLTVDQDRNWGGSWAEP